MRDIVFQGMWDVEAFNLFVRSRRDNALHVVLLLGRLYQQQVACPARRRGVFENEKCYVTCAQIYMSMVSHVNLCFMLDIFSLQKCVDLGEVYVYSLCRAF